MKVLFPATHYYPVIGGIETWTKNIAEGLSKRAEVFVVTGKIKDRPKEETINGVKVYRTSLFTLTNLSASPLFYTLSLLPFVFFKSLKIIKKENIDIIHCQGFLSSLTGFCLSKITKAPYIVTVQRQEKRGNPLKEFVYRQAVLCIGASNAVKEYFKRIGAKNIEAIPNGIDLEKFENVEKKSHEGFVVMTVARLEKVKGVEYLIKAFDELRSNLSKEKFDPFKLSIIGDGSERKNLEGLAKELGLENKVKFLGEIPNDNIPGYLAEADCFVLPSLREGFGIAILEAQAAGVPVVGSKAGGIKELIEDGKTGLLVEPCNPEALAQAILKIYHGQKFAKPDLGKYNWGNIAEKVYEIYRKIL